MDHKEKAAEAKRAAELKKELKALSDAQLQARAEQSGVDLSRCKTRDDVETAIEKHEHDAAGKARLEALQRAEDDAARNNPEPSATAKIVHGLNNAFCADIPQEGRAGNFVPEEDGAFSAEEYDVPDGTYRVAGSDWYFVIKGKKLAQAARASAENKWGGKDVVQV